MIGFSKRKPQSVGCRRNEDAKSRKTVLGSILWQCGCVEISYTIPPPSV